MIVGEYAGVGGQALTVVVIAGVVLCVCELLIG